MTDFTSWLEKQLEGRGLSKSEFATLAEIDTGTISNLLNGMRKPGPEICRKVARALKLPQAVVFYEAGILTEKPDFPDFDPVALDILSSLENRTAAEKQAAKSTLEALFENMDRGRRGPTHEGDRRTAGRQGQG